MLVQIDGKSWDEGFYAGAEWNPRTQPKPKNPYPPTSTESFSWLSGWIEGDAKRQGFSYTPPLKEQIEDKRLEEEDAAEEGAAIEASGYPDPASDRSFA